MNKSKFRIVVQTLDDPKLGTQVLTLEGREGWALYKLHEAGLNGCTPLARPAPRWSAYVHLLRKRGFTITTVHEIHGGQFAGHHGRYVMVTALKVISVSENGDAL